MSEQVIQNNFQATNELQQQIKDFLSLKRYTYIKQVGSNFYSKVIYAYSQVLKENFAIKIIIYQHFEDEQLKKIKNEIYKYSNLIDKSNYNIQIYEQIEDPNQKFIGFVYDYFDCNLESILDSNQFTFDQVVNLTKQLLECLSIFQEKNAIHCNIKPQNILFNKSECKFVIVDYGVSYLLEQILSQKTKSILGSNAAYQSPELLDKQEPFDIKSDVFSVGLIITEALLKRRLQGREHINLKLYSLERGMEEQQKKENELFLQQILFKMVNPDLNKRLIPSQLLDCLKIFYYNQDCLKTINICSIQCFQVNKIEEMVYAIQYEKIEVILKNKNITAEGAHQLQSNLIKCQNLTFLILDLQTNAIGIEGATHIGFSLKQLKNLTSLHLNLSENYIQVQGINEIGLGLSCLHQLQDLKLNFCDNKIGVQGAQWFASRLHDLKLIKSLDLNLDSNDIQSVGVQYIIQSLQKNTKIESLRLSLYQNNICQIGVNSIEQFIQKLNKLVYLNINLCDNDIQDPGANSIGNCLEKLKNLKRLYLNLNKNNIKKQGASNLFKGLQQCVNITELSVVLKNNKVGKEGAADLVSALGHLKNMSILKLDFCNSEFDYDSFKRLAYCLSKQTNLKQINIDLRQNELIQQDKRYFQSQIQKLKLEDLLLEI
ncbi:Serine/Threonine kinase domain protein (macronuclear) [Tetrahymena thermophila SB210]|uniref:Serine/Threonine kinase domain protein n=1 Tax=Tetrahymena thermophila (strain SB210) TaxID=312017 RepID=I7M0Q2_TETTS|nr:Serine/Threonine kinase domain protein [Tetrahymena thermophila SB210]EAR90724.2 Serine/Threonine kinase domain protein [Tetrahymena thermophila SB210]|eukprot:XP_001010969.2 Serine/Threonine kinase domain protein [Tetrahymena thermophila SB210]